MIRDHDAWLLENHGALTAGKDPYQAFFRMEAVELFAKMMFIAKGLGGARTLDLKEVKVLAGMRKQYGVEEKANIVFPKAGKRAFQPDPACIDAIARTAKQKRNRV